LRPWVLRLALLGLAPALRAGEGAAYLKIPQGAASASLGSAFVAQRGVEALWYTPAALVGLSSAALSASRMNWLGQTSDDYLAAVVPWGSGGLGLWTNYVGTQDTYRDDQGNENGSFGVYAVGAGAAIGAALGPLGVGAGIKAYQERVEATTQPLVAADLGLQMDLGGGLRLGGSARDLGPARVYDPALGPEALPATYDAGLAWNGLGGWLHILQDERFVPSSAETSYLAGIALTHVFGTLGVALRGGYDQSAQGLGGMAGFSMGAGVRLEGLRVDLAYQLYGALGSPYRMTLGWDFGAGSSPAQSSPAAEQPALTAPAGLDPSAAAPAESAEQAWERAKAAEASGDLAAAQAAYEGVTRSDPSNALAWGHLAKFHYGQGHKAEALNAFDQMLKLKPDPALSGWVEQYRAEP
jgi:hypothetical protein